MQRISSYYARWLDLFTPRPLKRSECATQCDYAMHYIHESQRVAQNHMVAAAIIGFVMGGLFLWCALQ